jgi:hypothetical protein
VQTQDQSSGFSTAQRRLLILAVLIVTVTLFWVLLLYFTNLPTVALVAVGLLSLVTLSIGAAWAAMALPGKDTGGEGQA